VSVPSPNGAGLPYYQYKYNNAKQKINTIIPGSYFNDGQGLNSSFMEYTVLFHGDDGCGSSGLVRNGGYNCTDNPNNASGFFMTVFDADAGQNSYQNFLKPDQSTINVQVTFIGSSPNGVYALYGDAGGSIYCVDTRTNPPTLFWQTDSVTAGNETIGAGQIHVSFNYSNSNVGLLSTYCTNSENSYAAYTWSYNSQQAGQTYQINNNPINSILGTPMAMVLTNSGNMVAMAIVNLWQINTNPIGSAELFDWPSVTVAMQYGQTLEGDGADNVTLATNSISSGIVCQFVPNNYEFATYDNSGNYLAGTSVGTSVQFRNSNTPNRNPLGNPYGNQLGIDDPQGNSNQYQYSASVNLDGTVNTANDFDAKIGFTSIGTSFSIPQFSQIVFDQYGNIAQTAAIWSWGPLYSIQNQNNSISGFWPTINQIDSFTGPLNS
jgi:hypothetical protein